MKLPRPELMMLMLACLLAAVIGGQVNVDPLPFAGIGSALQGNPESVSLTRLLIGLPIFIGIAIIFFRNRVVHFGRALVFVPLVFLIGFMCASPLLSQFPEQSWEAAMNWLLYGAAFMLGTAAVGRRQGVWMLTGAVAVGAAIVACKGVLEYASMRSIDPTHRIFAGWGNPNSLASLLIIAIPLTLGLCVRLDRPWRFVAIGAGSLQLIALLLTQSKGGFLAAGIALVVFALLILVWNRKKESAFALAPLVVAGLFMGALIAAPAPGSGGAAPLNRLSSGQEMAEQSSGVRSLLWKTAVQLIQDQPQGYGAGTFRFHSAQPGLVEQTVFAHQTYLEAGVEGGFISLAALLAAGLGWLWLMLAGSRSQSSEPLLLKASMIAAVAGWGAHSMLESTLSTFGIGVLVFAILGAGLQTAADGTSPELLPRGMRFSIAAGLVGAGLIGTAWFARVEASKSAVLSALANQDSAALEAAIAALPDTGESAYLKAMYGFRSEEDRFAHLERAIKDFPSTRVLRALATTAIRLDKQTEAEAALRRALMYDPNNLPTYKLMVEMYDQFGDNERAVEAARRALEIESQPSFQVRALAEVVPTQTYEIRIWLAQQLSDRSERIKLLQEALDGFSEYRRLTVPQIERFAQQNEPFLGETLESASEKLDSAQKAGYELAQLYSEAGDPEAASAAREAADSLSLDD